MFRFKKSIRPASASLIFTISLLAGPASAQEKPAGTPAQSAAEREAVQPDARGVVSLPASLAEVMGTTLRYEPQPNKNTLGYWTKVDDKAAWDFELPAAGSYKITLLQGCGNGSGGSLVQVLAGKVTLSFTVRETGGFQNFVPLDLGPVSLPAGRQRIVVAPQTKPGPAVMDLRLVTLTPAKTEAAAKDPEAGKFDKWEDEISQIEARLKADPPAPGCLVFAGSSSIRLWNLKKSFPDLPVVNCGFGGSVIADSTHFASRILLPVKPRLIAFYAGDNDSANGLSAEKIASDFTTFADTIHASLPECRILFIPIKPSIARANLWTLQSQANGLIRKYCESLPAFLEYVDLATPLLTVDGKTQPELYQKDGLHLSPAGYAIWNKLLRPRLDAAMSAAPVK